MNRIERYLGGVVLSHTLLVWLVLLVILGFSEFMIQLGKLDETYTLAKGALYTLLKLPVYGYEIFPVALLIGTLMGLGGLANHAELTVLRVTGWSIGRILLAVLKTALLMWLVVALMGEWLAPQSETYAKKLRSEALQQGFSIGSGSGFWLKDPERFIHVKQAVSPTELHQLTLYEQKNGVISQVLQAKKALFVEGRWQLQEVRVQTLTFATTPPLRGKSAASWPAQLRWETRTVLSLPLDFPLKPEVLESLNIESRYMSLWGLHDYIGFLQENDLDAAEYQLAFWRKLAMPWVVIGLIAIVFPLIFGSQRQVSMGQRVFVGILIGMGFHLLNQMFGNLSIVYHLSAAVGAFLPALTVILLALLWLKRTR